MRTYRLTWVASVALLGLVVARLARLLRATESGIPWPLVVLMGAVAGGLITLGVSRARFRAVWVVAVNVALFGIFFSSMWVATPLRR